MHLKRVSIGISFISIVLLFLLNLSSTPITDDYCMAYGVKKFGIWETVAYYNSNWTPSIVYYYLALWGLPFSSLTNSFFLSFISMILFLLFMYRSLCIVVENKGAKDKILIKTVLGILLLASLALVQSSVYFNSTSARDLEPLGILKDWLYSNFASVRDGQILLWAFSTPLTAPKIYLSAAVILFVLSLNNRRLEQHKVSYLQFQLLFLFIALLVGLTTESLLLITFLVLRSLSDLKNEPRKTGPIFIVLVSLIGVGISYLASGSQNRAQSYSRDGLQFYLSLFLGNVWQFAWMLLTIALLALVSFIFLAQRLSAPITFPDGLRINLRLLGVASLLSQLLIETLIYPAAYHWFSLLLVCSIWFFVEIGSTARDFLKKNRQTKLVSSLYGLIVFLLLMTVVNTISTANDRKFEWSQRANSSLSSEVRDLKDIPALNNLGERFAQDLSITFPSIVPLAGVKDEFTMYCYKKLPIGF